MKKAISLLIVGYVLACAGDVLANSKEDVYRAAVAAISTNPEYISFVQTLNAFNAELDIYETTPGADPAFVESMKNVLKYLKKARIEYIMFTSTNAVRPKEARKYIDKIYDAIRQAQIHLDIAKMRLR